MLVATLYANDARDKWGTDTTGAPMNLGWKTVEVQLPAPPSELLLEVLQTEAEAWFPDIQTENPEGWGIGVHWEHR